MPRFCRFCGRELKSPDALSCPSCGRELGQAVASEPSNAAAAQQPVLVIRIPGQPVRAVVLDRPAFTIGRRPDSDIVLAPDYVSGSHGRLELVDGTWRYTDLGSTNGTFVNGQRTQTATLRDGDILRIGDPQGNSVSLTFRAAGVEQAPAADSGVLRIGATALGMASSLIIGRDPQADLHLPSPVVSWRHARLDRAPGGHVLHDLGSTNGTFVNGQRLTQPHPLQRGDVVQIGPFRLVYEATGFQQYAATGGVRLDGVALTREVGRGAQRKRILSDVNISVYPREFVALVGGSGAGKTTLLMALNGFSRAQGQVLVNGDNLYQHFDLYRTMVGYVPQDDIVHEDLTVASALRYAARLRLPPDTSAVEIERRVDAVLQQVGMAAQKEQLISSLSGGQRKRVSIAAELLAEPNLFFLDEPTSGLDPGLEKKMMHTLRRLADGGRTVVLVTHATANITQCDHVCFLSQGRMVYFGPPEEALSFFGVTSGDFADIYDRLDVADPKAARARAAEWEQRFRQSPQYQQYVAGRQQALPQVQRQAAQAAPTRGPRVNPVRQFLVLTRRYLDLVWRNRLLLTALLAIMPVIALLMLLIAKPGWLVGDAAVEIERQLATELAGGASSATYAVAPNSQRLLFMMALAAVLLGLFAAAYEIVKERPIFQRERMVTLRLLPYLASKLVVLAAFALLQCLLFLIVIGLQVDMPAWGVLLPAPLEMYITLFLGALTAITMGLFVSSIVPNTNTVIYVILVLLFFQILFAGVIFELPAGAQALSNLTLTRWTMEGLGATVNMDELNSLGRTRFLPDPVTRDVSTVVPIEVPQVTAGSVITVTRMVEVAQTVTIEPEPVEIVSDWEFQIHYDHTVRHLLGDWLILLTFTLLLGSGILIVLRRQDVG